MKRDATDKVFSDCVRERANWTCERCGTYYPEGKRAGLECSHFHSRRKRSVRFHPQNAAAHCTGCHFHLGGRPIEFQEFQKRYLGEPIYNAMRLIAGKTVKLTKPMEMDIRKHLKAELKRMRELRANGAHARIEFELPPHLEKPE